MATEFPYKEAAPLFLLMDTIRAVTGFFYPSAAAAAGSCLSFGVRTIWDAGFPTSSPCTFYCILLPHESDCQGKTEKYGRETTKGELITIN